MTMPFVDDGARRYYTVEEMLKMIEEPNGSRARALFADNEALFKTAPGSSKNHQAWKGGYYDHICETMNLAVQLYATLDPLRKLPFSLSDALLVLYLHDLEKPWKYTWTSGGIMKDSSMTKAERKEFRAEKIAEYRIKLTAEHENAMRYVEGIPDEEYTPGERIMGPLACFCHVCDITSARLWYDYPLAENDPWAGLQTPPVS